MARKNPTHRLKVTAPNLTTAKARARRFGRLVDIQHKGGDQYLAVVDQPAWSNPMEPVKAKSFADYGAGTYTLKTDKEIREYIRELREEITDLKKIARRKRKAAQKMTWTEQMIEFHGGDPAGVIMDDIEDREAEVMRLTGVLTRRREQRRKEREAKKPPKPVVLRRRAGVVTRANAGKRKNPSMREIMRRAMK